MEEQPTLLSYEATCKSIGCGNEDITLEIQAPEEDFTVLCGVCAKEITQVVLKTTQE